MSDSPDSTENKLAQLNRAMPCALDAEKGFLCGIVHDPSKLERYRELVPVDAMYHTAHRILYEALREMSEAGKGTDFAVLTGMLRDRNLLEKIGGPGTISALYDFTPVASHWQFYRKQIMAKWLLRKQIAAATTMIEMAFEFGKNDLDAEVTDFVRDCEALQFEISEAVLHLDEETSKREFRSQVEVLNSVIDEVGRVIESQGAIQPDRVPTGFTDFDRMTGGGKAGQVFVLAARPAMGKTSGASNMSINAALGEEAMHYVDGLKNITGKVGAFISLEMSAEEILAREYVGGSGVDMTVLRMGVGLRREQMQDLANRSRKLQKANLYWLDVAGLSWQELRSKLRSLKTRLMAQGSNLHFACIDYLQLLKSNTGRARGNREIEISEISSGLKMIAKELGIFIIVLAQLNRKAEERANGEPELSDLRESGSIEQDADIVGLLWRPNYYNENADERMAILKIAKHRGGPTGSILLDWDGRRTQFHSTCDHLHSNDPAHQQRPIPEIPSKTASKGSQQQSAGTAGSAGKPNYASKDYQGPRGRPRKGTTLDEDFPNSD